MIIKLSRDKLIELSFLTIFSAFIIVLFYNLISMNGVVLGNDPAVHLQKAQLFLFTGDISLANIGWTPPLYQIFLAILITFTGATGVGDLIFLVKISAVILNWLLFLAVYLITSKFFSRKVGALSIVLLLMCFPIFELNLWGGYTTVLGIAFMLLLFLYLPLSVNDFGYMVVAGIAAFAVVLSHQLTMFIAVLVLAPVMLYMIIKSRGKNIKALLFIIIGGGVAFFLYYFRAMIGYLGGIIEHVFFAQKAYAYQISQTTLDAFWVNFGFIFILGVAGLFVIAYTLWIKKKHIPNLTLILSFIIPLFLAESWLFGLLLPFQWFIYYLTPPLAILSAVSLAYFVTKSWDNYKLHKKRIKKLYFRAIVIALIVVSCLVLVLRTGTVYSKINEAADYYSTSDIKAYEAGIWLANHYPQFTTVVATEVPGSWLGVYSGKMIIAETSENIERNLVSEAVLDLSYEIETPLTLTRSYEAKGEILAENYVSINHVWYRVSYNSAAGDKIFYEINGENKEVELQYLNRAFFFESNSSSEKNIIIVFSNDEVEITKNILIQNSSYPTTITWNITPLKSSIKNVGLYLTTYFDLQFSFTKAYLPGILNWENPWSNPTGSVEGQWAVTDFSKNDLPDNYLALYDDENNLYYAINFNDTPDWGDIGALASMQIDAVRMQYNFTQISQGNTQSFSYQTLTFSQNSYSTITEPDQVKALFTAEPTEYFTLNSRDYYDYIKEYGIGFIAYDRNQLDIKLTHSRLLELVYSNDRYVIFKVRNV